jgi:hypothetical protein
MSNLCSGTREQEEIKMINVENRTFEISTLLSHKGMQIQNLVAEISELIYFAKHPEEKENN